MGKMIKLGFILAVFCVISAGGLAYVYLFTGPRIEENAKLTLASSRKDVLPSSGKGRAILVTPQGYGGKIELLVGIDELGKVSGVKVISHKETAGLGAGIEKPAFLAQFKGKTVKDALEPKKDIDAITGATISSRAVCAGVKQALQKGK